MKKPRIPSYRLHKASGQAVVTVKGKPVYLGKYGTAKSKEEYREAVADLVRKGGGKLSETKIAAARNKKKTNLVVVEAAERYLTYSKENYGAGEHARVRAMLKYLTKHCMYERVGNVGPAQLREIQNAMVKDGLAKSYITDLVTSLRRMFAWLVELDLVHVNVHTALMVVKGPKNARKTEPIRPVDDAIVEETLPHLPKTVADMVRLQRITGMRPAELCLLRPCDVDQSSDVWIYRPSKHKTEHHDKDRVVHIGPKAQEILRPYLQRPTDSFCFQPRESEAKRRTVRGRGKKRPIAKLADCYDVATYRRAIHRACDKAFPHPDGENAKPSALKKWQQEHRWSPNRLRHTAGTEIRAKFGLEAAQVILGHSHAAVTQIYAERDMAKGAEVARQIG